MNIKQAKQEITNIPDKAFICLPRLNASVIIHKAGVVVNNFF